MGASDPASSAIPIPRTASSAPPVPPGRPPVPPAPPGFDEPPERSPGDDWFRKIQGGWGGSDPLAQRERLLRTLKEDPFDPLAHRRLGEWLLAAGQTADALEEFRWAVVLAPPECLSYRYCLLGAYCGLRMVEAATEEAGILLKLEPEMLNRELLVRWLMVWAKQLRQ